MGNTNNPVKCDQPLSCISANSPMLVYGGSLDAEGNECKDDGAQLSVGRSGIRRWATNTEYMQSCTTLSMHRQKVTVTAPCPKDVPAVLLADTSSPGEEGLYTELKFFAPVITVIDDASVETAETDDEAFCRVSIGFTPTHNAFDEVWGFGPGTIFLGKETIPFPNFRGFPWARDSTAVYLPKDRNFMCLFVENRLIAKTVFPPEIELEVDKEMTVFVCAELCPLQTSIVLNKRTLIPAASEVFAMLEDEVNHAADLCGVVKDYDDDTLDVNSFRAPEIHPLTEEALKKSWTCRICDLRNPSSVKACMECHRVPMDHVFKTFQPSKSGDLKNVTKGGYAHFLDDIAPGKTPRVPKSESGYNITTTHSSRKRSSSRNCYRHCSWGQALDDCL